MVKSGPLYGPFSGDVKPAPGAKEHANGNNYGVSELNQPADGDVVGFKFFEDADALKGSPAALATPHGTATESIGKTPSFNK